MHVEFAPPGPLAISVFVNFQPTDLTAVFVLAHGSVGIELSALEELVDVPVNADEVVVPDPASALLLPLEHASGRTDAAMQHTEIPIRRAKAWGLRGTERGRIVDMAQYDMRDPSAK